MESAAAFGLWQMKDSEYEFRQFDDSLIALQSDPICGTGGCVATLPGVAPPPPMDYFVPNFGKDPEVWGTLDSLALAEQKIGHKVNLGTPESAIMWHNQAKDAHYNFKPDLDEDVVTTQKHMSDTSAILNHDFNPQVIRYTDDVYRYQGDPPYDF